MDLLLLSTFIVVLRSPDDMPITSVSRNITSINLIPTAFAMVDYYNYRVDFNQKHHKPFDVVMEKKTRR